MSRWRAALIHLGLSFAVFSAFFALTYFVWYPEPYFSALRTVGLIGLLGAVDVVLGPSLTLLIFKSGKKNLKWDLTVIAAVQLAALAYGTWTVVMARPISVVFSGRQYSITTAIDAKYNSKAPEEFKKPSLWGPVFAYSDHREADIIADSLNGSKDALADALAHYRPLADNTAKVLLAAQPLKSFAGLAAHNPAFKAYVDAHPQETRPAVQIVWRAQTGIALLNPQTAKPELILTLGE